MAIDWRWKLDDFWRYHRNVQNLVHFTGLNSLIDGNADVADEISTMDLSTSLIYTVVQKVSPYTEL